ncbi:long-chain-fatty-acid--CoA ligase ACSBG2-like [Phyllobates terribilis]|uniref:long-chain-fatty-acid--CoA ligase ACSBG2-like n=1 Tax=Phyllobates terribilis TaxID=111132 RepID=UPI003CCA810B
MATIDVMEEDSTESFVDLSEYDETVQEEEQPPHWEHQGELYHVKYGQKPDVSQGVTCDHEKPVTPMEKGLASREGNQSDELQVHLHCCLLESPPEHSSRDDSSNKVRHTPSGTLVPGKDAAQDIPAEDDTGEANEGNPETQRHTQEIISERFQDEDEENHDDVSDKPRFHSTQGDKGATRTTDSEEENGQKATSRERSSPVNTEETIEDSREAKEAKKEEQHDVHEMTGEEAQRSKDGALEEQKTTTRENQEQSEKIREDMSTCEEQSLVIPRWDTAGRASSESLWTSRVDGTVTLRMEESGPAALRSLTVSQFFSEAVMRHGQKVAMCVKEADKWKEITYSQYGQQSRAAAKGFLKLGLQRFHAVLILGFNSPEWIMAHIGAILAGGLAVGIDPLSTPSTCLKLALDSRAQIVLVDDHNQREKILQIQDKLPNLKAVIQWRGLVVEPCPGAHTWNQLLALGSELEDSQLDEVAASQKPHQSCAVMYAMDDAGEARGALISHDNVTWTSRTMQEMLGLGSEEVVVSYLTLSHMSAQMFDLWLPLSCGGTTYFAESDARKGSLVSTLRDVHPTFFMGFPGLWEKVNKQWILNEKEATPLQKMTIRWARKKGLLSYRSSGSLSWGYSFADRLVFRPARMALGLDRCTHCYVGTEPICHNVMEYFGSLGIGLLELSGKNETSGVQSVMLPSSRRTGR